MSEELCAALAVEDAGDDFERRMRARADQIIHERLNRALSMIDETLLSNRVALLEMKVKNMQEIFINIAAQAEDL